MKKNLSALVLVLSLILQGCNSFSMGGGTPTFTPTLVPLSTSTVTPTATITVTPPPSSTPTPWPTQVEIGTDGLPIFPEDSISRGDGIEIDFSQAVLNDLGIKAVVFDEVTANDLKQMLLGQWLYILRTPEYKQVNPKNLDDLKHANSTSEGVGIQLEGQYINIRPNLSIRIDFVRGCRENEKNEFSILKDTLTKQSSGRVLTQEGYGASSIGWMRGGGGSIFGFTYIESYSIRIVNYVDCYMVSKYANDANEAVAEMLRTTAIYSYEVMLIYMRHLRGYASDILSNKRLEERIVSYDEKWKKLAVLGGCQLAEFFCQEGTATWNFTVVHYDTK